MNPTPCVMMRHEYEEGEILNVCKFCGHATFNFDPKNSSDEAVLERSQYTLDFIKKFKQDHGGNSPSTREILEACGFSSTSHVRTYLKRLVSFGLIEV